MKTYMIFLDRPRYYTSIFRQDPTYKHLPQNTDSTFGVMVEKMMVVGGQEKRAISKGESFRVINDMFPRSSSSPTLVTTLESTSIRLRHSAKIYSPVILTSMVPLAVTTFVIYKTTRLAY